MPTQLRWYGTRKVGIAHPTVVWNYGGMELVRWALPTQLNGVLEFGMAAAIAPTTSSTSSPEVGFLG